MYFVTVKKFLATMTSCRNCNSQTLLWLIMQTPLISLTHLYAIHTTHYLFIYIQYHSRMNISDEDFLNEDSVLVPATQNPNTFSSQLIRQFSLKRSQQQPVQADTIINNTNTKYLVRKTLTSHKEFANFINIFC